MIPFTANAAATLQWRCSEDCQCFEWPGQSPKIDPSLEGSAPHVIKVSYAHPSLQLKRHVDRFSRFCTAYRRVPYYFTMVHYVPQKIVPSPWGQVPM